LEWGPDRVHYGRSYPDQDAFSEQKKGESGPGYGEILLRRTSLKFVPRRDTVEGSGAAWHPGRPGQFGRSGRDRGQDTDDSGRALADKAGVFPVTVVPVPFVGREERCAPAAIQVPMGDKRHVMGSLVEGDGEVHGKKQDGQRRGAEIPFCPAECAVDH